MDVRAHLTLTTLCVNEGSSRCGIHHDPPAPLPALVAGSTCWDFRCSKQEHECPETAAPECAVSPSARNSLPALPSLSHGVWEQKHRGGRLFLFDGLFDLSYGPRDLVLLDGRYTHGVSALRDLKGVNQTGSRPELRRFSLILFSAWQREKMKGEKRLRGIRSVVLPDQGGECPTYCRLRVPVS